MAASLTFGKWFANGHCRQLLTEPYRKSVTDPPKIAGQQGVYACWQAQSSMPSWRCRHQAVTTIPVSSPNANSPPDGGGHRLNKIV